VISQVNLDDFFLVATCQFEELIERQEPRLAIYVRNARTPLQMAQDRFRLASRRSGEPNAIGSDGRPRRHTHLTAAENHQALSLPRDRSTLTIHSPKPLPCCVRLNSPRAFATAIQAQSPMGEPDELTEPPRGLPGHSGKAGV
jgi:hypothetical protein